MIKLIIADDERTASELIASCLEKSGLDVEVTGIFDDGAEAIEFVRKNEVDIVMTDIKMPVTDGLELSRILNEEFPQIKIVIFSGFDEFEFARKAISYGVSAYLLKPIKLKELFSCISKLSKQITSKKSKKEAQSSELQEEFLNDLTMGIITDFDVYSKKFDLLSFPFEKENSGGVILTATYSENDASAVWKYGRNTLLTAVLNVVEKTVPDFHIYPLEISKGTMRFILIGDKSHIDRQGIEKEIKNELELDIKTNIFKEFDNLWNMSLEYKKDISNGQKLSFLISQIVMGNELNADIFLQDILKNTKETEKKSFINQLKLLLSLDESTETTAESIIKTYNKSKDQNVLIEKACRYINKNYMNDITRDDVADYIFMNSSYFSRYFRQKTGMNFYDYLVNVRMEKAKELLLTNKKIEDIGKKVGYQYSKYFIKNFKRHTGYTPSDYRKYVLKNEDDFNNENEI